MTTIRIDGEPLARFDFDYLPSANEAVFEARKHKMAGHKFTKFWRLRGASVANRFMLACGNNERAYLIQQRAFVWVKVYRAEDWPTYDVHNPYVKPLLDGFTDESLWPDDDWPNIPQVLFSWQPYGLWEDRVNKFVVEVHELDAFIVDGVAQILPSGRIGERGD